MNDWSLKDADAAKAAADLADQIIPGTCKVTEADGTVRWFKMPSGDDAFWAAVDRAAAKYGGD